jgi:hypothetical protein
VIDLRGRGHRADQTLLGSRLPMDWAQVIISPQVRIFRQENCPFFALSPQRDEVLSV